MTFLDNCHSDIDRGIKIINRFLEQNKNLKLTEIEQAIIHGSLARLTYQNMQQQEKQLNFYTVEYISRNLAFDLWNKLSAAAHNSQIFDPEYRINKKKLWHFVDRINQLQEEDNFELIDIPGATMEGEKLQDRYEIEEHLFDRDSGERHFRAIDRCLRDKPCLVIQRNHQTPKIRKQFEREGEALSHIGKHYQIQELLAYFTQDRSLYLVYEQIEGKALTELLTEEPWQELKVKELLHSLLTVLVFIQEKNITHRNLNPDNIILSGNKWVFTDFATIKEVNLQVNSLSHSTFAEGMKDYMPAEQLMGMTTFASDIYAVGMIAIRALTGIQPHQFKINPKTGNKVWRKYAEVSDLFADTLARAVSYHFGDRYQSAQEMLENIK
ncbi:protein kinase [Waterburya agarophytonicola K14]|uniref:non-specific serine/threonine protein kinase n=1 Tax=Waterburya agarophytonicola KI4 TaxID=2874699 RepID=A0A964BRT2_9CYAN|nr:protein kinase [Waterburya agarophytonicola]MCC0178444.1 protein kinase [Waterburya agarophytonicola KI4]